VIGIGSIGERHIKNLKSLGVEVSVFDTKIDVFTPQSGTPELTPQLSKLERLVQEYDVHYQDPSNHHTEFDAFIICTPPAYHINYAVEGIKHNTNLFIEKPISNRLEQRLDWVINTAEEKGLVIQIGYQLRFHSGLKLIKNYIEMNKIGKILNIRAEFGQYLPNWRPNQDYRESYTGKKSEGGGIILESSHEIDYVGWLSNSEVSQISCFCGKQSSLDIDTEDTAEINLRFEDGVIGNIHVDMTQKGYTRWCKVTGTDGTLFWDYNSPELTRISSHGNRLPVIYKHEDPYLEEMKHFIACIENKTQPMVDATVGKKVLEIALAAKKSSEEGRVIEL